MAINLCAGYAFAKLRFPIRNVLFLLIISTLMIPVQVIMVPQFQIVIDLGWLDTYWGWSSRAPPRRSACSWPASTSSASRTS